MSNDLGRPRFLHAGSTGCKQNFAFRDQLLELAFDLSKRDVLPSANTLDTIPRPLLDRMEVIQISGYTEEEKRNIASRYLIPKQMKEHGIPEKGLVLSDATIGDIINYYTREAGVRNLERQCAISARAARRIFEPANPVSG